MSSEMHIICFYYVGQSRQCIMKQVQLLFAVMQEAMEQINLATSSI